jgi:RNA polymerase sigma factor (TIGR02999 family)
VKDVTRILNRIQQGDTRAVDRLLPLVYEELRILAAQKLSQERPGQTLQPTALVHEAYLRLVDADGQNWQDRGHFFIAAAEAMRRILIENARRKQRCKRGGGRHRLDLNQADVSAEESSNDLIALDEALARLAEEDAVKADLVKLRYFAGLTAEQAAEALGISRATAARYWSYARAWLFHELDGTH